MMDADDPLLTALSFGPSGVDPATDNDIPALVEAADEIGPPKVGDPNTRPGLEVLNTVPAVTSSPPTVSLPEAPRGIRMATPGRVRLSPVELAGSVWKLQQPRRRLDTDCLRSLSVELPPK
jgi:hypothetical protein